MKRLATSTDDPSDVQRRRLDPTVRVAVLIHPHHNSEQILAYLSPLHQNIAGRVHGRHESQDTGEETVTGGDVRQSTIRGYQVEMVTGEEVRQGVLESYQMLYAPGGSVFKQQEALGQDGLMKLQKFVHGGGSYLGVCAGALLAAQEGFASCIEGAGMIGADSAWSGWARKDAFVAEVEMTRYCNISGIMTRLSGGDDCCGEATARLQRRRRDSKPSANWHS